jgi:predicted NAD-dependent protein-ADP-ribosyltransferase YbiA (DUF1768 family)
VKDEVMLKALRAKFTQHADLRAKLLETGDRLLVEHQSSDVTMSRPGRPIDLRGVRRGMVSHPA